MVVISTTETNFSTAKLLLSYLNKVINNINFIKHKVIVKIQCCFNSNLQQGI